MLLPEVESLGSWRKAAVWQVWLQSSELLTSSFHDFGDNFKLRVFSSGRPRGTTLADDRYIVLQARRNRRQIAGEIARHTTQISGRSISRFGQKTARLRDALYGVYL
ncbi:hypothetical protein TNCV_4927241 [Trichonephila clavipes]|nr:hypothetical protein TNCV_4927241 [Trichonephila clavipes]